MKKTSITRYPASTLALCAALIFTYNGMAADRGTLNADDSKFVKQEHAAGLAAVKLAGLGAQKAVHADVKAFAETLVIDHTKANEDLSRLAATKGVELPAVTDSKHAEKFKRLETTEGADFDRKFLAALVSGHEKCVTNLEATSQRTDDSELKQWTASMLPVLEIHLAKARELSAGSATTATESKDRSSTTASESKERSSSVALSESKARSSAAAMSEAKDADNTERNKRDRNDATLTPFNQGNSQADVNTTAQIRREIIAAENLSVNAQNVKIITNTGKVTLRGPVNSAEEKRLIGEIANRIALAENVDNQLEVQVKTSSK